jgi:hypothetical protein
LRFRYREHRYYNELSETEKEMLDRIDKKYYSRSCDSYWVDVIVHEISGLKAIENEIEGSFLEIKKEEIFCFRQR